MDQKLTVILLEYNSKYGQFHYNYWIPWEKRFHDDINSNGWMPVCVLTEWQVEEEAFLKCTRDLEAKKASYEDVCKSILGRLADFYYTVNQLDNFDWLKNAGV